MANALADKVGGYSETVMERVADLNKQTVASFFCFMNLMIRVRKIAIMHAG